MVANFELAFTRYRQQFENGRKFDSKNSLQDFDAKKKYLHPKNRPVSTQRRRKMCCLHHCRFFTRCRFQNVPIRVPFSKSAVFKICRQKMCRFRVNRWPIRRIFHRFQNVPASCERSLSENKFTRLMSCEIWWVVVGCEMWLIFKTKSLVYHSKANLDEKNFFGEISHLLTQQIDKCL